MSRRAGVLFLKVNGTQYDVVGEVTYNLGRAKREALVGLDGVHGHKEMPQAPFIEATLRDRPGLDMNSLLLLDAATVVAEVANGKAIVLRNAWFEGDGTVNAEEATITARFVGLQAEEV